MTRATWVRAALHGPDSIRYLGAIKDGQKTLWQCDCTELISRDDIASGHREINEAIDCAMKKWLPSP